MNDERSPDDALIVIRSEDQVLSDATRRIIDAGFGAGTSYFMSTVQAWVPETVDDLYRRYNERPDTSSDKFLVKLERQLSDAPDATILLATELITLQALPLEDLTQRKKLERLTTVLAWMDKPAEVPKDIVDAFAMGSWAGGQGAHMLLWKWLADAVTLLREWWKLPEQRRAAALTDPWVWRDVVRGEELMPSLQEALLWEAFPHHFQSIVNPQHKARILRAFESLIEPTGDSDKDLLSIVVELQKRTGGGYVNLYDPPLADSWQLKKKAERRAWLVRPRAPQSGDEDVVQRWRDQGFVSLAATYLGDVPPESSRATVNDAVEDGYKHVDYPQRLQLTSEYHAFLSRMAPEDLVMTVANDRVWAGIVTGDAEYVDDRAGRLRRPVNWSDTSYAVDELPAPLPASLDQQGVVVDLTGAVDAVLSLFEAEEAEPDAEPSTPSVSIEAEVPTLAKATDQLAAELYLDRAWIQETLHVLQDRQQIIFYGPPGTGKTYLARALGRHVTSADAMQLVQFHPSYAYEDFFEGYRPTSAGESSVGFELQPGPLRRLAAEARADPSRPYVLIVDEINRGNLAKIFGELYFLLEYRKESIRLQYSPDQAFTLPPNVFIIGTMNTADRSIALVDAAIRRRFAFIELHPDEPPVRDLLRNWLERNHKDVERARLLDALNDAIGDEDRDFKIGPSYLMTAEAEREGGLARVWRYSLLPLLEEHYYGRLGRRQIQDRFGLDAIRAKTGASVSPAGASSEEPAGDVSGPAESAT